MDKAFIQGRIAVIQTQIIAYDEALFQLAAGVETYSLDTGQTRTTVTKLDIDKINKIIDSLENRCLMLSIRINGGGSTQVRPAF